MKSSRSVILRSNDLYGGVCICVCMVCESWSKQKATPLSHVDSIKSKPGPSAHGEERRG